MSTSTNDINLTTRIGKAVKKGRVFVLATVVVFVGIGSAHAKGSIKNGSVKARACQVCHGKGGHSTKETYPVLAGQHAAYIRKQLHAFRDGTRKDPIMNGMAAPLSDQDIEDVAAYFNSNK